MAGASAALLAVEPGPWSSASEGVFSLVQEMFGKDQLSAMADVVQGSLMLRYNNRRVG